MSWHIRLAVLSDIELLVQIDPLIRIDTGRRDDIENAVVAGECWVACAANQPGVPVGYGCLDRRFFAEWFISLVVVSSAWRRSGIGQQWVTHLERCCAGVKIFTSTNTSNEPMRQLLRQLGYQDSGRIENLDPGDPELAFVKSLSR